MILAALVPPSLLVVGCFPPGPGAHGSSRHPHAGLSPAAVPAAMVAPRFRTCPAALGRAKGLLSNVSFSLSLSAFSPSRFKRLTAVRPPGPSQLALSRAVPGWLRHLSPRPETSAGATGALGCSLGQRACRALSGPSGPGVCDQGLS